MIEIGFEWPVAREYVLYDVPASNELLPSLTRSILTGDWREGYSGPHIRPKTKAKEIKRPLEIWPTLFIVFAGLEKTPDACLAFAEKFGLLGLRHWIDWFETDNQPGEPIKQGWYKEIDRMRKAVDAWQNGTLKPFRDPPPLADLKVVLVEAREPGRDFNLQIRPPSLLHAMWLQFAQAVATGNTIKACEQCGGWFEVGQVGGRRRDARFCSDKCRVSYNNQQRPRKKAPERRGKGGSN